MFYSPLYALSKNALCTVSPSSSKITLKYFPTSDILAHFLILPSDGRFIANSPNQLHLQIPRFLIADKKYIPHEMDELFT